MEAKPFLNKASGRKPLKIKSSGSKPLRTKHQAPSQAVKSSTGSNVERWSFKPQQNNQAARKALAIESGVDRCASA